MCSLLYKIFIVSALLFSNVQANEKAAEHGEKAEGGEAKAEAKSEGKDEYAETQNKVSTFQAKIKSSEEIIEKIIEEKQHTKEAARIAEIIKNLVTEHKSMEKSIEEYEKARSYLQYRFPEKGLKGKRQYERFELKSLEDMEHEMTMEARLKKTLYKVRKQYGSPEPAAKELKPSKSSQKKNNDNPELSSPVILTK